MMSHEDAKGTGASLIWGQAKGDGTARPGEEKAQGRDLIKVYKYLKGVWKEDGAKIFPDVPSESTRWSAQDETQEAPPECEEIHF